MKFLLLIISIFIFPCISIAQENKESSAIKEAIVSCLSTVPKNTDNKPNRDLVKKCLETKGIQPQKEEDNLSSFNKDKRNEALKQCHSLPSSSNRLSLDKCLKDKGV